ncbi:MAG: tetratricopeptide repeat protein, partial [Planctomycetes bacterium]|nr:tetratricopeptide repeat protein [Planctomycetota bacterium]
SGRDEEGRRILVAEAVSGDASDEIHTALGALALGRGETDEAVRCWRRAVEADRGFFAHRLGLARALRIRSEGRSEKGGDAEADLDEADRILAAGLALDSGRAGMWTELALVDWSWARARSAAGRDAADALSNALAAADRALALAPQDLEAANVRGAVFLELGKLQEAIEAFGGVLAADPGHFQAHNNRALARLRAGDALQAAGGDPREEYLAAIRGFEEAIALRPRFTWAHGNLGWTWKRMGNHEHLLGLDPNGSYDNASRSLSTALDLSPRSAGIWNNLAAVHLSTGDYRMEKGGDAAASFREALDALDQSLAANPGYYLALGNKGYAWMRLGEVDLGAGGDPEEEFGRAIRSFEASLAANPAHEEGRRLLDGLRVERGLSRLRAGRPAEAIAELDAALESIGRFGELDDPDFRAFRGEIHLALARAHARLAAAAGAEAKRERDLAFESLARALADGAVDSARARRDPDLAALSSDPRWEAALGGR